MTKRIKHAKQEHKYYSPIALQVSISGSRRGTFTNKSVYEASEMHLALDRVP